MPCKLLVVTTYEYKENTCTERKNIHLYTCISENIGWAEYIGCPPNVIVGWAAAHPAPYVPAPLDSGTLVPRTRYAFSFIHSYMLVNNFNIVSLYAHMSNFLRAKS